MKKSSLPGIKKYKTIKEALRDMNKNTSLTHEKFVKKITERGSNDSILPSIRKEGARGPT